MADDREQALPNVMEMNAAAVCATPEEELRAAFEKLEFAQISDWWDNNAEKLLLLREIATFRLISGIRQQKMPKSQCHEVDYAFVGGGPLAVTTAAMLLMQDTRKKIGIVAPDLKAASAENEAKAAWKRGRYRQSGGFITDTPETLQNIQQFYDMFGVEVMPVESALFFETEADFDKYAEKIKAQIAEGREDVRIIDLSEEGGEDLPIDTERFLGEGYYPKVIIQRKMELGGGGKEAKYGACNINMQSLMEKMKAIVEKRGVLINARAKDISKGIQDITIEAEGGHFLQAHKAMIAAGGRSIELAQTYAERMQTTLPEVLDETYDILGAPTVTYDLPQTNALRRRPMNVEFVRNGDSYAFGIIEPGEGGKWEFRFSLFDLEREGKVKEKDQPALAEVNKNILHFKKEIAQVEEEIREIEATHQKEQQDFLEKFSDTDPNDELFLSALDLLRNNSALGLKPLRETGEILHRELAGQMEAKEKITGVATRFKSLDDLPRKTSGQEEKSIARLASILRLKGKPKECAVEPHVVHYAGYPILDSLTDQTHEIKQGLRTVSAQRKPEIFLASTAEGGAGKFFLPIGGAGTWTELAVRRMQAVREELITADPGLADLWQKSTIGHHVAVARQTGAYHYRAH